MTTEGIGARVRRREDERLLRGRGRYVGDIAMPGVTEPGYKYIPTRAAYSLSKAWPVVRRDLPRITAPVLLLHSTVDHIVEPVNAQFRDDRFTAAFTRSKDDKAVFTVAYVVRAVSPGRYVLPQAVVEDMYRPDRFGRTDTGALEIGTTP